MKFNDFFRVKIFDGEHDFLTKAEAENFLNNTYLSNRKSDKIRQVERWGGDGYGYKEEETILN